VQHENDLTACAACVIGNDPGTSVIDAVEAMVSREYFYCYYSVYVILSIQHVSTEFQSECAAGGYSVNSATVTAPTGTASPKKGAGNIVAISLSLAGCLIGMVLGASVVLV
jgi:hypothetical protein